ncbi:MAG: ROK family protein [Anaerolineae bacterium]|nr:ROK family protein [Anaerolineae bacterium]
MQSVIGVDVGGTLLRSARFDQNLTMIERFEQSTEAHRGSDVVIDRLAETIRQALPESPDDLMGIGIVLPGPLDPENGILIAPPNLPIKDYPIAQQMTEMVGGPVFIGNDADLAGLAEYSLGAGRGYRSIVYITISTGIGGGLILDGKLHTGRGQGGEIGHMVVDPDGPICGCGHYGHLEAFSSGTGIARIASERLREGEPSLIHEMVEGDLSRVTAKVVGNAAKQGDPLSVEIITNAGRYLGVHIASLMMLINPDAFVLGGGLTKIGDLLFNPMYEAIRKYAMHPRYWENTPILPAKLGADVGLVGAAALVKMRLEQ